METMQSPFGKFKKILKFVWRHILTLFIFYHILTAIFSGPIQGENALGVLGVAIFLDWAKKFIKFGSSSNPYGDPNNIHSYGDVSAPLHIRQRWDPGAIGNCAYESDNYPRIKRD